MSKLFYLYRPADEAVSSPSKGRARSTQSPTKKESVSVKNEKDADSSTPRKSSRQVSKTTPQPTPEKAKNVKASPSIKKATESKSRTESSTNSRASKPASNESTKKSPTKDAEQLKSTRSSHYKPSKPINPIELIDELQGIEDFLRESTNESTEPEEKKGSPKKTTVASESKTDTKDKTSENTPGSKVIEITSEAKSALGKSKVTTESSKVTGKLATKEAANVSEITKSAEKVENKPNEQANKITGTKRKLESSLDQSSKNKVSRIEEQTENEVTVAEDNRNNNTTENSDEPVRVFVAPEVDSDDSKVTDGKCGNCANCNKKACFECSSCKREDFNNCIDVYCLNQRDHRDQRLAMRELYLQARQQNAGQDSVEKVNTEENEHVIEVEKSPNSLQMNAMKKESNEELEILESIKSKKSDGGNVKARFSDQGVIFEIETTESESEDDELSIEQKIDKVMARIVKNDKLSPERLQSLKSKVSKTITEKYSDKREVQKERKKNRTDYVYGGSSKAKKVRRCGECEGCTRDDCGKCIGCLDKPKFGGKNTRKQACTMRKCRMK